MKVLEYILLCFIIIMIYYLNLWTISILIIITHFSGIYSFLKLYISISPPKKSFIEYKPSILIILGSGGHTWEMFNILSKIKFEDYLPIYIVAYSDPYSLNDLNSFEKKYNRHFFVERIIRPREHFHLSAYSPIVLLRSFYCFFQSTKIIYSHKPDFIIANGPSISVPVILAGSFLKKIGITNLNLIYVESAARVNSLSISAKIIKNYVDYIFGFWDDLCYKYKLLKLFSKESDLNKMNKENKLINNNEIKKDKNVLVTVGTTNFKELIEIALSESFQKTIINQGYRKLIIQIGNLKIDNNKEDLNKELKIEIITIIPSNKFSEILKNADLIISHGGAGTIIQSINYGKKPIVIPNNNVIQNHQIELINHLQKLNYINYLTLDNLVYSLNNNNFEIIIKDNFNKNLSEIFRNSIGENLIKTINNDNTLNDKQISIVIPMILKDYFLFQNLLFSIQKFIPITLIDLIYVIIPDNDFKKILLSIEDLKWKNKIQLIKESNLIPLKDLNNSNILLKNRNGWFKQQIFKLYSANIVKTKFYMILDSDCIFINPLESSKIFIIKEEKIIKSNLQIEEIFIHEKWWKGSSKILGITKPYFNSLKNGIGVTPQILSVEIVKELCLFIEKSHNKKEGEKWYNILWNNRIQIYPQMIWTEFTLYYLFAMRSGMIDKYHICKQNCFADYFHCVWELHESFEWNPKNLKFKDNSFLTIFQSNTHLSHRIPKAFINQYNNNQINDFISCFMFINQLINNQDYNSLLLSINCFINQSWNKDKRELVIFSQKENEIKIKEFLLDLKEDNIKSVIIEDNNNLIDNIILNLKGNFITVWPQNSWSSQYRLSIQFDYIKEQKIDNCYISPFILVYPDIEIFNLSEELNIEMNNLNIQASLFCNKQYFKSISTFQISNPLNEPTIFIYIKKNKNIKIKDAIKILEPKNKISLYNELLRITCPYNYNSFIIPFERHKTKIYIISSELEFYPIIGGINTFLRVIISELEQTKIHLDYNTEFIFCGIQCGKYSPKTPEIKGVKFKFFQTEKSKNSKNLSEYFKSFSKYSETMKDLQIFGEMSINYIKNNANYGDICISTIIYEFNIISIKNLIKRGIKLIHTVHSLTPLKIMNNLRSVSLNGLSLKEKITALINKLLKIDEYKLVEITNYKIMKKILPKFIYNVLDIEKNILNLSKIIIIPSKKLSKIASTLYPNNKNKIKCIPWGLPEKEIIGEPLIYFKKREKEDELNKKINCLALCKIVPQKGIDILLDSFNQIETMDPYLSKKLILNICGDMAYMQEDNFYKLLMSKVEKLKYIKVNFKGWLKGEPKLNELINSDIFILPSLTEPFGFCILEAMKAGLPIISFETEGPSDIISPHFGRLVNFSYKDIMIRDLASSIIDVCSSNDFYQMRINSSHAIDKWRMIPLIQFLLSY